MKVSSRYILDRLTGAYGPVTWAPRFEPLDELIFTVLTQHTSDLNAERAYRAMRARYPHWEDVMDARPAELAESIRSGGLANQKSVRIQEILRRIRERQGDFDLRFLAGLPLPEAKAWLTDLPGVGPKTAAVTLSFALGMPAMPVDTHIYRVAKRLGLIGSKSTVEDAHPILEKMVDPADVFRFHVLLIQHGRRTCKARSPECPGCALNDRCPSRSLFYPAEKKRVRPPARREAVG
ncbi:MAG: endonuclease III [Chloroflexi bacterium]|nr:endonuclease III [Chloroflexota bacterium]